MGQILTLIGMGYLVMFCTGIIAGKMIERSTRDIYEVDEEGNIEPKK